MKKSPYGNNDFERATHRASPYEMRQYIKLAAQLENIKAAMCSMTTDCPQIEQDARAMLEDDINKAQIKVEMLQCVLAEFKPHFPT